ncbi:MAG: DNA repair protein RecO [Bdellovibrionales bacterium]|nr:DNA repair protein RecO [Bdellovibrionales bacterium]
MAETFEETAIVLRSVPYEERHRVVTALTEKHGKISALARNAIQSRRFGGTLEPFAAATWRMGETRGDLYHLDEATIRKDFAGLRKDFEILSLASVFNELMLRLAPEREPCVDLFKLHSNALAELEEKADAGRALEPRILLALLNAYLSKVLQWNGTQPQLLRCLGCERSLLDFPADARLRCHISVACWTCPDCRGVKPDSATDYAPGFQHQFFEATQAAIGDFYIGLSTPIRKVPELAQGSLEDQKLLFALMESLLIYQVPGFDRAPLKGLRFLPEITGTFGNAT